MAVVSGIGKSAYDWSYMTKVRPVGMQSENIVDPANIDDAYVIDLLTKNDGHPQAERGRNHTLVVHFTQTDGATIAADATILLFIDSLWATDTRPAYLDDATILSSSSGYEYDDVPPIGEISSSNRWALVSAVKESNAIAGLSRSAVFQWLPAGRYKVCIGTGLTGQVVVSEQHSQ